jgi:hypothetical protein
MSQTKQGNFIKKTNLTDLEKEVILGSLLGDGTLERSGNYHFRFRFCHTVKHIGYTKWKYNLIKRICISDLQYVKANNSMRVGTVGHSELTKMREEWYANGVKEVPFGFHLTPLILGIWFQDDGYRHGNSIGLSTHCFSKNSIEILRKELMRFFILANANLDGRGYRIYVKVVSYSNFKKLVKPYIQNCMAYKLP